MQCHALPRHRYGPWTWPSWSYAIFTCRTEHSCWHVIAHERIEIEVENCRFCMAKESKYLVFRTFATVKWNDKSIVWDCKSQKEIGLFCLSLRGNVYSSKTKCGYFTKKLIFWQFVQNYILYRNIILILLNQNSNIK